MSKRNEPLNELCRNLATSLEKHAQTSSGEIGRLLDVLAALREESADPRLRRLGKRLGELRQRAASFVETSRRDYLEPLAQEARILGEERQRTLTSLAALFDAGEPGTSLPENLLDQALAATGAERGFLLSYLPESTEAEILAAREFVTTHLPLEEYDFSRTLLGKVLKGAGPLRLDDASADPIYSQERSVRRLRLHSILAVPLEHDGRILGAIYLENNQLPGAFTQEHQELLELVARFAGFYLRQAGLWPTLRKPVFFDPEKAPKDIVTRDPAMLKLLDVVEHIADSPAAVLIEGESGTGKELLARALHEGSRRRERPLVAINCAAIPESLMESQLFGYEKGAFTGATERYGGLLAQADGGTIFFDEVAELAPQMQAKLLRFLQSQEIQRLSSRDAVKVDVRVVSATSRQLADLIAAGEFQEALYYRLNVVPLKPPPLRERQGDVALLASHFLERFSRMYERTVRFEPDVYEWLSRYRFPGNVRELENLVHRMVALAKAELVRVADLPSEVVDLSSRRVPLEEDELTRALRSSLLDLDDLHRRREMVDRLLAEKEKDLADRTLREADGNHTETARRLGVHRTTLYKMLGGRQS